MNKKENIGETSGIQGDGRMENNIFESDLNTTSNIYAVFEDDGITGWVYLYDNENSCIVADCWIYNASEANHRSREERKDVPPPLPKEYLVDDPILIKNVKDIRFKWSDDGYAVNVIINGYIIAYIDLCTSKSYNVNIKTSCPWGNPLTL
ncbi:MAG: hypothetical protein IJ696_02215 [Ruminococcus sp.]|nr:hypothetical protein [Ruminococcus sp.]